MLVFQFLSFSADVIMGNFVDRDLPNSLPESVVAHILNEQLDDRSIVEGIVLSSYQCIVCDLESDTSLQFTFLIS